MTRLHTEEFDVLLRDALRWLVKKKKGTEFTPK